MKKKEKQMHVISSFAKMIDGEIKNIKEKKGEIISAEMSSPYLNINEKLMWEKKYDFSSIPIRIKKSGVYDIINALNRYLAGLLLVPDEAEFLDENRNRVSLTDYGFKKRDVYQVRWWQGKFSGNINIEVYEYDTDKVAIDYGPLYNGAMIRYTIHDKISESEKIFRKFVTKFRLNKFMNKFYEEIVGKKVFDEAVATTVLYRLLDEEISFLQKKLEKLIEELNKKEPLLY